MTKEKMTFYAGVVLFAISALILFSLLPQDEGVCMTAKLNLTKNEYQTICGVKS
jgi:hypothetical protein